jgi:hypothetical protein
MADTSENRIKGKLCLFNGDNIFSRKPFKGRIFFFCYSEGFKMKNKNFPNNKLSHPQNLFAMTILRLSPRVTSSSVCGILC